MEREDTQRSRVGLARWFLHTPAPQPWGWTFLNTPYEDKDVHILFSLMQCLESYTSYKSKSQLKIKLPCDGTERLAVRNCDSRLLCTWLLQGVFWPPDAHCTLSSHTSTRAQKRSVTSKSCTHRSTHFLRFRNLCACFCGALSQPHRQESVKSTTTFWLLALGLKLKANPAAWTQS